MKRPQVRNPGIPPKTLLDAVENTVPFLFSECSGLDPGSLPEFVRILMSARAHPPDSHDLWDYFDLCLSAHFATVGTFVPTDVDLAIRQKLWSSVQAEAAFDPLWDRIRSMRDWKEDRVSKRWVESREGIRLSGHQGEWFSVAMGAYGCARRSIPHRMGEIREEIEALLLIQERGLSVLREEFLSEPEPGPMKAFLGGVAAVAHNLGDLDRMFEAWKIDDSDLLKHRVFRLGHEDSRAPKPLFLEAGRVYQEWLATENHRNFALRAPKALRRSPEFLLPFGLFLDDWGRHLVQEGQRSGLLDEGAFREVIEALVTGWKKLNPVSVFTSQGYARALSGMAQGFASGGSYDSGRRILESLVPPAVRKELLEGGLRTLLSTRQEDFERKKISALKARLSQPEIR
jgi:hypothetical protein